MSKEYYACVEQARKGTLPAGFNKWGMPNRNGWTVALEPTATLRMAWQIAMELRYRL
jgi:hypothetical protein